MPRYLASLTSYAIVVSNSTVDLYFTCGSKCGRYRGMIIIFNHKVLLINGKFTAGDFMILTFDWLYWSVNNFILDYNRIMTTGR